ncbi:unnamed protein product [Aphanomyces euteiches]|uniref:Secreted protein n=1 Tax=Aphanomyces euteiches TaxID=100861 RepID=A0A6G0W5B2_9STRA|nr:hypothetical protein Ae201684_018594 [Aphanomyces euteiches]KAH9080157.1 hypothetical protein Ae201684P_009103 [Aphanomyces euteiches]KAH9144207.1 hypothetical protein AeRB84_011832 [Aphanomyces euteiches]
MQLAVVVATILAALAFDGVRGNCFRACHQNGLNAEEDTCTPYRDQLPRPALFNYCVDAYRSGNNAACTEYCNDSGDADINLGSIQNQACDHLRSTRPKEALTICNRSFRAATTRAKEFVGNDAVQSEPVKKESKKEAQSEPEQTAPKKKTRLEAAREEAAFAFAADSNRLGEL